jgi:hypothetical protein
MFKTAKLARDRLNWKYIGAQDNNPSESNWVISEESQKAYYPIKLLLRIYPKEIISNIKKNL